MQFMAAIRIGVFALTLKSHLLEIRPIAPGTRTLHLRSAAQVAHASVE